MASLVGSMDQDKIVYVNERMRTPSPESLLIDDDSSDDESEVEIEPETLASVKKRIFYNLLAAHIPEDIAQRHVKGTKIEELIFSGTTKQTPNQKLVPEHVLIQRISDSILNDARSEMLSQGRKAGKPRYFTWSENHIALSKDDRNPLTKNK